MACTASYRGPPSFWAEEYTAAPSEAVPIETVEFKIEKPDKELIPEYYTKADRINGYFVDEYGIWRKGKGGDNEKNE